jgi:hypothetical protein
LTSFYFKALSNANEIISLMNVGFEANEIFSLMNVDSENENEEEEDDNEDGDENGTPNLAKKLNETVMRHICKFSNMKQILQQF